MTIEPINPGTQVEHIHADPAARAELSKVTPIADDGVFENQLITFLAKASIGAGDFIIIKNAAGQSMAVWMDTTGSVTTPSGPLFSACTVKIKADIHLSTTAASVATAVKAAISGGGPIAGLTFTDNLDGTISVVATKLGNVAAPVPHNAAESTAGTIVGATVVDGHSSSLQNKYFTLQDGAAGSYYGWLNVNSEGVDPAPGGTGVAILVATGATKAQVAADIVLAFNSAPFSANLYGVDEAEIHSRAGAAVDIADVNTGFSFSVLLQGQARGQQGALAADSPGSISNDPAAY